MRKTKHNPNIVCVEVGKHERDLYHAREVSESKQKAWVRDQIVQFMVEHHEDDGKNGFRFFGFPAERCYTERALFKHWGHRAKFVGIDYHWSIIEKATQHMPGPGKVRHVDLELQKGDIRGFENNSAIFLNSPLESFCAIHKRDVHRKKLSKYRYNVKRQKKWNKMFQWSCAWIDTYGYIESLIKELRCLNNKLDRDFHSIPIAVTFMCGREKTETAKMIEAMPGQSGVEKRGMFLAAMLDNNRINHMIDRMFNHKGVIRYKTDGGVGMGVLLGTLERRSS